MDTISVIQESSDTIGYGLLIQSSLTDFDHRLIDDAVADCWLLLDADLALSVPNVAGRGSELLSLPKSWNASS